ncbi:MAG TPA: NAD(P)-binding domain-containing protein, partial [Polyangiaceae bacterium]
MIASRLRFAALVTTRCWVNESNALATLMLLSVPVTITARKIAFIGLGKMGAAMCARILEAGFELIVYNRTQAKTKPFADAGASVAKSPRAAATGADVVITSLIDDESVFVTVLGEDGLLAGMRPGAIHLGTTTVLPKTAVTLGEMHRDAGSRYVSGPVLGRPDAAASGELRTFLSGDTSAIAECSAVVAAYAAFAIGMGEDPATSMAMKVCANYIAAVQIELMGEV